MQPRQQGPLVYACLETAHVARRIGPVNLVPLQSVVESCTRRGRRRLSAAPHTLSRHLPCLLCRFAQLCRDERPRGSQLAFARGNVGDGLNPCPPHYRTAFASSVILYPQPRRLASRLAFPFGRTTGLTRSAHAPRWFRSCLSAGGRDVCDRAVFNPCSGPLTFWFKPSAIRHSTFGLRHVATFIGSSHLLTMPSNPASDRPMLAVAISPCSSTATPSRGETYLVPEASHCGVAPAARSGRIKGQNPRSDPYRHLLLDVMSSDSYVCDFVSHENRLHGSKGKGGTGSACGYRAPNYQ